MKRLAAIITATLILPAIASIGNGQDVRFGTFRFEAKRDFHLALIVLETIPFDSKNHRVVLDRRRRTFVDGHFAFGTDGYPPQVAIASLRLYVDGSEVRIPKRLYFDCYQPNPQARFFKVSFGPRNRSVIVAMNGADGAASYTVKWSLNGNGHHKRSIYQHFSRGA